MNNNKVQNRFNINIYNTIILARRTIKILILDFLCISKVLIFFRLYFVHKLYNTEDQNNSVLYS